jgi:hypothetical protein
VDEKAGGTMDGGQEKHPLEGSFYEGLFVKRLLALFIFVCTDK